MTMHFLERTIIFFIIERLNVPITIFVITSYLNNVYPYINHEQLNILNKSRP